MEQRNGRIDRKLRPHDEVVCHYFVYKQRAEDRALRALVRKTDTIKRELGSPAEVIEGRLANTLTRSGIRRHDLSRACLAQAADAIPRVVRIGRLCLYGAGAARLHEKLLAIAARWVDPEKRKGPLTPYAREAEGNTARRVGCPAQRISAHG
jgi:hypothetical protein